MFIVSVMHFVAFVLSFCTPFFVLGVLLSVAYASLPSIVSLPFVPLPFSFLFPLFRALFFHPFSLCHFSHAISPFGSTGFPKHLRSLCHKV